MHRLCPVASQHPDRLADADRVLQSGGRIARKIEWMDGRPALMDASGLLEGALVVSIAVSSALHVWLAWKMEKQSHAVAVALAEVLPSVRSMGDPSEAIQDVRDEITDTINGVLGAMHVPTAADHLMGTIAAIAQARFLGPLAQAQAALTGEVEDQPDLE